MFKIRNTGITDKWDFRHTSYVATATQHLKDLPNSSLWTFSDVIDLSRSENTILALGRFFQNKS